MATVGVKGLNDYNITITWLWVRSNTHKQDVCRVATWQTM